jgi:hypothetical protein
MAAYNTGRMPRLSLEHLIRSARDVRLTEGGDSEIIIDRSVYASRKNGRLAEILSSVGPLKESRGGFGAAEATRDLTIEAKYWRNLYMTLKQENNEDIQDIDSLLQLTLDREGQLMAYSRLLERKIDSIIAPLQDSAESIELSKKLDTQRKLLRFYETMTSLSVKRQPGTDSGGADLDDSVYDCVVHSRVNRASSAFSLQVQVVGSGTKASSALSKVRGDGNTVCRYQPISNTAILPEYLHRGIDCEPSMAPVILSDVLHAVYETAKP